MGLGSWLKGVFGGGAKGAATGAPGGPWGALAGLGAGAVAGGISSSMQRPAKQRNISRLTPQQQQWNQQRGEMGMEGLRNPYAGFEPIEQNARSKFQTSTIPTIAERYTSMGSGGQNSSAFDASNLQAGADLESNLAALRSEYGFKNRQLSGDLLNQSMGQNFDTRFEQQQPGFLQSSLGALAEPLGQYGAQQLLGTGYEKPNDMEGMPQQFQGLFKNPKFLSFLKNPKTMAFLKAQGIM